MSDIEMQSVISSNVSQAGFSVKTGSMRIAFKSGGVYEATGVTQADFDAFLASKSKGQYFGKVLKSAFAWNKIVKQG